MDDSSDHEDSRAATPERPNGEERWRALFADLFDQFDQKTAAVARLEAEKRELEEKLKKAEESRLAECTSCKNKPPASQQTKAYFWDGQCYKTIQITKPATAGEPAKITVPTAAVETSNDTKKTPVVEQPKKGGQPPTASYSFMPWNGQNYNMFCSPSGAPAGGLVQPAAVGTSNHTETSVVEQQKIAGNAAAAAQANQIFQQMLLQASSFTHTAVRQPGGNFVAMPVNGNQKPATEKPKSPQKAAVAPARSSTVSVQLKPAVQPPTAAASDDEPIGLYEQMRRLKADVQRLKEQREEDVETLKHAYAVELAELRGHLVAVRATRAWLEDEVRRLAVAARPKEPQEAAPQADEQPEAGPSGLLDAQPPADEDDRASVATARSFHSADSSAVSWENLESDLQLYGFN
ncbi:hypothetical protein M3Y99_00822500 [Aphelenchoides fujianensis]|nr:hypothetical protein M3Y99_00822500 [Aphelenchoides fujianensis]